MQRGLPLSKLLHATQSHSTVLLVVGRLEKTPFFSVSCIQGSQSTNFFFPCCFTWQHLQIYCFYQYLVLRKSFIFFFAPFLPTHWISSTEQAGLGLYLGDRAVAQPTQGQVTGVDKSPSLCWESDWKPVVLLSRMETFRSLEENFRSVEGCSEVPFRRKRIPFRPYPWAPPWDQFPSWKALHSISSYF